MKSDLDATRELCHRPGVLEPELQEFYRVVRQGMEILVARADLSYDERSLIINELRSIGRAQIAEANALGRHIVKDRVQ